MRLFFLLFFFFKQKTAYAVRISDWSSDVCSSDLQNVFAHEDAAPLLDPYQAPIDEAADGAAQRVAVDPEPRRQFGHGRQPRAPAPLSGPDLVRQRPLDLPPTNLTPVAAGGRVDSHSPPTPFPTRNQIPHLT